MYCGKNSLTKSKITLKNQYNEEIDNQITHIIIEISKFEKAVEQIVTDLDKLIFIMRNQELLQYLLRNMSNQ